jgi:hypothetical protein
MKSSILWDVSQCSPLEFDGRFGGTFSFHLQGRRISLARNPCEAGSKLVSCLAYSSTLKMEGRLPPKLQFTFNGLDCVLSQMTELSLGTSGTQSFGMWRKIRKDFTEVSEENLASIFRVVEQQERIKTGTDVRKGGLSVPLISMLDQFPNTEDIDNSFFRNTGPTYQTIWCHTPDQSNLHINCSGNLNSRISTWCSSWNYYY